jgi:hypothetical protein
MIKNQKMLLPLLLCGGLLFSFFSGGLEIAQAKRNGSRSNTVETEGFKSAFSESQQQQVTQWEQQLLGLSFIQEPDAKRIARLEAATLGKNAVAKNKGLPLAQRINQLAQEMASLQPKYPNQLIASVEQQQDHTVRKNEEIVFDGQASKNPPLQDAEGLAKLEKKLVGTVFTNDTTDNRLRRLELKVFGATATETQADATSQQRLDRLIAVTDANPRGGVGDLKRDRFLQEALPINLTSILLIL